ncbi:hypothetical protein PCIT_a4062 [Pseudoalteromonas citrea]|uniref:Uncharacterized protein n=1 Tax=Pseudoalteromonas citrea TaxID=43655 RepID=A0AAD4AIY2_9GAMM|nr:hypothetical protein PCIT_a4062 [Pseudoalteromonas citrea]
MVVGFALDKFINCDIERHDGKVFINYFIIYSVFICFYIFNKQHGFYR